MYKIEHLDPTDMGDNQQELADYVMEQVKNMSFDNKDDFNEGAFIQTACQELGWATTPQTGGFEVWWGFSVQIDGASTTISENELLSLAEEHNVPSWLIENFDEPLSVVFTYVWQGELEGEYDRRTPLSHLMRWIERESDNHYTFNS
jgi:hypothetical protein